MTSHRTDDCSRQGSVTPLSPPATSSSSDQPVLSLLEREALSYFAMEADSHLRTLRRGLMQWSEGEGTRTEIDTLFRAAHTLKGSAYMVGLQAVGDLIHSLEDILEQVRSGHRDVTPELATVLLGALDAVSLVADQQGCAPEEIHRQVSAARSTVDRIIASDKASLLAKVDSVHGQGVVGNADAHHQEPCKGPVPADSESAEGGETSRVTVSHLDRVMNLADRLVIVRGRLDPMIQQLEKLVRPARSGEESTSLLSNKGSVGDQLPVMCLSPATCRGLLESVREQMDELRRLLEALVEETAKARLVPIDSVFSMVRSVASNIARRLGKTVSVQLSLDPVRADLLMVNRLASLVGHLVRNAVYHGIELPHERSEKGKPEAGLITVRASLEGRLLVITVEDDGRGVNLDAVRHRAMAMGVSRPEAIASAPDSQVLQWIFIPGLSTAPAAGDLAGRGVGLDAVKASVEAIGGQIDVVSWPDRGTSLTMRLPLRLLRARFQLVRVESGLYAVPHSTVRAVFPEPQTVSVGEDGRRCLMWNHMTLEVQSIESLFHDRPREGSRSSPMIVIQGSGGLRGVMVDELVGVQDLTVRAWDSLVPLEQSCFVGTALNREGQVVLVLDPNRLEMAGSAGEAV